MHTETQGKPVGMALRLGRVRNFAVRIVHDDGDITMRCDSQGGKLPSL
jgi:hypothetical protein